MIEVEDTRVSNILKRFRKDFRQKYEGANVWSSASIDDILKTFEQELTDYRESLIEELEKEKSNITYHDEGNIRYIHQESRDSRYWEEGHNKAIDKAISIIKDK